MVLDYSDFIEQACCEEDATYGSWPSEADVLRNGRRFISRSEQPKDPFAVTQQEQNRAVERWLEFARCRWLAFGEWHHLATCPCCSTPIEHSREVPHLPGDVLEHVDLRFCRKCGWWDTEEQLPVEQEEGAQHYKAPAIHRRAVLRQFDIAESDIPIESLRSHLTRHPDELSHISPQSLEKLVAAVFRETMDCEAIHVGGPNDRGIDVVLVEGKRRYVIQTKRRSGTAAEGVAAIREFVGVMVLADEMRGIFVTTARKYSPAARETARTAVERDIVKYIDLVDAKRLMGVCQLAGGKDVGPWKEARSKGAKLSRHTEPGMSAFMALFIGHPDWHVKID